MKMVIKLSVVASIFANIVTVCAAICKCIPSDACWPSVSSWEALNRTVSGNLIRNIPVAAPCYPGPEQNAAACTNVEAQWTDVVFQANHSIGYLYPHQQFCDIPGGNTTTCELGDSPVYSINATSAAHVVAGVDFARDHNVRLVIKMTGHDLIGRSTGPGSLEIWLRHLRTGIEFQQTYTPTAECKNNAWAGSAIFVGGGYSWMDVYPVAQANNVIVVGGGCPSVGSIGGYTQGGGHSLANHAFGLAADQLLEAQVVLADGSIVTASACQNSDLYTALRGGGGGTYGIILSAIIKAHPEVAVTAQTFSMAPITPANLPQFMEAVAIVYGAFPDLLDGGLSGYGSWAAYSPTPVVGASTTGLTWSLGAFNQNVSEVMALFAPTAAKLAQFNESLSISTAYLSFPDYFTYYFTLNGVNSAAEVGSALVSRLFSRNSLMNSTGLRTMLNVTAGAPSEFIFNELCVIGGGAVLDASDPFSGVNPAWRETYVLNLVARGWADTADFATVEAAHHDLTFVKGAAMTALAPDTGSYMSEGDWQDPDYLTNYYGGALPKHEAAKRKYDPNAVFYCPTCVGSEDWEVDQEGRLCRV